MKKLFLFLARVILFFLLLLITFSIFGYVNNIGDVFKLLLLSIVFEIAFNFIFVFLFKKLFKKHSSEQ